ncbi:hypothetical protein EMIHUDRAFT_236253 [Emiliania huxleyi CCMP1516]|uniref:Uncharacterized protein n=2 Tax=Emiliania huxleyi TaxID=2903 RepID=A0A0D3JTW3_EMIH1|nr:hypothetical protein EMIHUDRAFT_236253 [Emiliania huxleyi CCMP1516]EOD26948.1 hypothetical protein EMIHUDRAFT_236253 [Emiliania huxleyi CCMP1516]|eukprot:XP_005779377.1 hypothetical protein EMIHUDRAFT_236253 [Emiliania huxleyi CCMP1516]
MLASKRPPHQMPTFSPRQVGKNEIWTEHVRKEMAIAASGCKKKYTSNPFPSLEMNNGLGTRSYLHTEKVGHNFRLNHDMEGEEEDAVNCGKVPRSKYAAPQSSAQEVGWYIEPLVPPNPRFNHKLVLGDATKFAENYSLKSAGENACIGSWLRESRDPVVSLRLLWCLSGEHMFHGKSGKYLRF